MSEQQASAPGGAGSPQPAARKPHAFSLSLPTKTRTLRVATVDLDSSDSSPVPAYRGYRRGSVDQMEKIPKDEPCDLLSLDSRQAQNFYRQLAQPRNLRGNAPIVAEWERIKAKIDEGRRARKRRALSEIDVNALDLAASPAAQVSETETEAEDSTERKWRRLEPLSATIAENFAHQREMQERKDYIDLAHPDEHRDLLYRQRFVNQIKQLEQQAQALPAHEAEKIWKPTVTEEKQEIPPRKKSFVGIPIHARSPPPVSVAAKQARWLRHKQYTKLDLQELKREIEMDDHMIPLKQLELEYETHAENGLIPDEAKRRLTIVGPNVLTPPRETPLIIKFLRQLFTGFSMLLWVASGLCFIAFALDVRDTTNAYLGAVIIVVIVVTGAFAFYQEYTSSKVMAGFKTLLPPHATVIREGLRRDVLAQDIVPGDVVELSAGMRVPADMRLSLASELLVDNSSLTGESVPKFRTDCCTDQNPLESKNMAFCSTIVTNGSGRGVVLFTGDNTIIGRIAGLTSRTGEEQTPIKREINRFVFIISIVASCVGLLFFCLGFIFFGAVHNLIFGIGIIVANVPEGLIATVTLCLTHTARTMAERKVVVKNLEAVETLGSVSVICTDKTGTLTQNKMEVQHGYIDGKIHSLVHISHPGKKEPSNNVVINVDGGRDSTTVAVPVDSLAESDEEAEAETQSQSRALRLSTNQQIEAIPAAGFFVKGEVTELVPPKHRRVEAIVQGAIANPNASSPLTKPRGSPSPKHKAISLPQKRMSTSAAKREELKVSEAFHDLVRAATLCNRASFDPSTLNLPISKRKTVGDPTESGLIKFVENVVHIEDVRRSWPKLIEIAFNSRDKYSLSIHVPTEEERAWNQPQSSLPAKDNRLLLVMKGAPERVINKCSTILVGDSCRELSEEQLTEDRRKEVVKAYEYLASKGERVLGFCQLYLDPNVYTREYHFDKDHLNFPVDGLCFTGLISMLDPPKPEVAHAVKRCRTAGIKVIMVTGDHPLTAKAIARKVGIIRGETADEIAQRERKDVYKEVIPDAQAIVISGEDLQRFTPTEWDKVLAYQEIVFARTSPQQKLNIVEANQRASNIVAVTGDGVNDAPALKKADIGVAMESLCVLGISGSDVSKEAADMVLLDDSFASIVAGVEQGRLVFDNLKKSIAYTLEHLAPEVLPFLAMFLFQIPAGLTTILILCIDLGTDLFPAIACAYEEAETDIMTRMPRNPKRDKLAGWRLLIFSYLQIGLIQAAGVFFTYFFIFHELGFPAASLLRTSNAWDNPHMLVAGKDHQARRRALMQVQSAVFISIIIVQWAGLLVCKTRTLSLFQHGMRNKAINIALVLMTLIGVFLVYTPGVNTIVGAVPIPFWMWLPSLPFALLVFVYDETRKLLIRRAPNGLVARLTYY